MCKVEKIVILLILILVIIRCTSTVNAATYNSQVIDILDINPPISVCLDIDDKGELVIIKGECGNE